MRRVLACVCVVALLTPPLAAQIKGQPGAMQGILVDVTKDEDAPTGAIVLAVTPANLTYSFYEGSFASVPKFSDLTPKHTGRIYGFDLILAASQHDYYAISFDGFVKIDKEGTYKFHLASDDGSTLAIDGKRIITNDGIHGTIIVSGEARLTAGMHKLHVGYFQNAGPADLRLHFEGPGVARQDIVPFLSLTADPKKNPATAKFIVNEKTRFETVRGNVRNRVNFLAEHRGERVDVFQVPGSSPPVAARVEIVLPLPPPPPPPHVTAAKGPRPIFGTVVEVGNGPGTMKAITVRLHEPPAPVLGQVVDVAVNEDKEVGFLTVKVNGKTEKFTFLPTTRVFKWTHNDFKGGSFLSLTRGETVLVYPMPRHPKACIKVDVMDSMAAALHQARHFHRHHLVTFQTTPTTLFVRTREGKNVEAAINAVQVGEEVGVWPTAKHAHIAHKVDVYLPHTIHGVVFAKSAAGLGLHVHKREVFVPINAGTVFQAVDKKVHTPTNLASLAVGEHVVVYPAGPAPHIAEKVVLHPHHFTASGMLLKVGQGTILVRVHHAASKDKPAHHTEEMFQVLPGTSFEIHKGKTKEPATVAALNGAGHIVVHARQSVPPVAERVTLVFAPIIVHGHLLGTGKGTVTLKVHHPATKDKPAHDAPETFYLMPSARIEVHRGKLVEPGSLAALKGDHKIAMHGYAGNPPLADVIHVYLGAVKLVAVKGMLANVGQGTITVRVVHPPKGAKPAHESMETFQVDQATTFEILRGKDRQPSTSAALQFTREVIVHGQVGSPLAHRVEMLIPPSRAVTVRGHLVNLGKGTITVKLLVPAKDGKIAETFQVGSMTSIQIRRGAKQLEPSTIAVLHAAKEVVVHGQTGPPLFAERIEIVPPPPKTVNVTGTIASVGAGVFQLNTKDGPFTFQLTPITLIEAKIKGKSVPAGPANLQPGRVVSVQGRLEFPVPNPLALKIEIRK